MSESHSVKIVKSNNKKVNPLDTIRPRDVFEILCADCGDWEDVDVKVQIVLISFLIPNMLTYLRVFSFSKLFIRNAIFIYLIIYDLYKISARLFFHRLINTPGADLEHVIT